MARQPRQHRTPQPYAYSIRPVKCPLPEIVKQLNPWNVQEFFRIEFLLRSDRVMEIYRRQGDTFPGSFELFNKYGFGVGAFTGRHHRYLNPKTRRWDHVSIQTYEDIAERPERFLSTMKALIGSHDADTKHQDIIDPVGRQFLYVIQASPNVSPEDILNKLRPILAQCQQGPFNKLRKFGVKTWLNYLASYDLHVAEGRSYAESGKHVYGKPVKQGRSSGKTGWQRVKRCIEAAETGDWPPAKL